MIRRIFCNKKVEDVFTPNKAAKLTYISRPTIEKNLEKDLKIDGKQVILYGPSGSGKTTLIRHMVRKMKMGYVITHCMQNTTMKDLVLSAFDKLDKYYISQKTKKYTITLSNESKMAYESISDSLKTQYANESEQTEQRILPPQLTPERLAQFFGEANAVWIIEDFHKVPKVERVKIADVLKIFIGSADDYKKVRVICIGAVGKARELLQYDPNLYSRISEIEVPLLSDDEIINIIRKGSKLLNIEMDNDLIEKIRYHSRNLGTVAHQMCYDMCYKNDIKHTCFFHKKLDSDKFIDVIESQIKSQSDSFRSLYESVVKDKLAKSILNSMIRLGVEEMSVTEITKDINRRHTNCLESEVLEKLIFLSTEENNVVAFNKNSNKYSFSTPFWEAFLRMQFAKEKASYNRAKRDRQIAKLVLKNQQDKDAELFAAILKVYGIQKPKIIQPKVSSNERKNFKRKKR